MPIRSSRVADAPAIARVQGWVAARKEEPVAGVPLVEIGYGFTR